MAGLDKEIKEGPQINIALKSILNRDASDLTNEELSLLTEINSRMLQRSMEQMSNEELVAILNQDVD